MGAGAAGELLATHGPDPVKKTVRGSHGHKRCAFCAAAGLTENRDAAGIAAEISDVVAHPFEREDEIELANVAGVGEFLAAKFGEVKITKTVETMVAGDDHDVAALAEAHAVVGVDIA